MASISRSKILYAIVIAALLAAVPQAILRIVKTGDPYLFTEQFFRDTFARLHGPGKMRFVVQPTVAIILGLRSGMKDAAAGFPPFLCALAFHPTHRRELLRSALIAIRDLVAIAILLDIVSQFLIFHQIRPGAALVVGPVLITLPYVLTRALTNRIVRRRSGLKSTGVASSQPLMRADSSDK